MMRAANRITPYPLTFNGISGNQVLFHQYKSSKQSQNVRKRISEEKNERRRIILWNILALIILLIIGAVVGVLVYVNKNFDESECDLDCLNGGSCVKNTCLCPSGFEGTTCGSLICSPACVNGVCTDARNCSCNSGWSGSTCTAPICTNSCQNNGTCTAPDICTCPSTYNGSLCQYAICSPSCHNGGNCTSSFTCQCPSTYTGSTCTISVCTPSCLNNGNCTAPNNCTCTSSWSGATCANPVCTNPCQNGGSCTAPDTCTCPNGYNGSVCQDPICNVSCLNGGTCIAPNSCSCIADVWTGPICQTPLRILWTFDNNFEDFYGNYPGVGVNGPTFSSGINGYGSCVYLNASQSQSIIIYSPPFLNMAYTSFTLVVWAIANTMSNALIGSPCGDNAFFGQCEQQTTDEALHITLRTRRVYFGLWGDDIQGNVSLSPGIWYHFAYVYDYTNLTEYVYVNGVLQVSGSPRGPYKGTVGNLTIGTNGVCTPNNYWDGCLDQITYSAYAKSATEVLREATLTVYLPFENNLLDDGPLGINGTGSNISYSTSGVLNSSLALLMKPSYVQVTGLVLLGFTSQSYSLSIWIKPNSVINGTIIHTSTQTNGYGLCVPMLGFSSSGQVIAQSWNGSIVLLTGPTVVSHVWTHVAITYSSTNGLRLYVNGTQYGLATGGFSYSTTNISMKITLGAPLNGTTCPTSLIVPGQYFGYLDEFQLYSRELTSSDVFTLANI